MSDAFNANGAKKVTLGGGVQASITIEAPSGCVMAFAGSSVPTGWLDCNGSAVSRTTYANLFAAIGTTWGSGDGATTFNLPDLRGRTVVGVGTGSGLTARVLAETGGAETHTLSIDEIPSHTHVYRHTTSAAPSKGLGNGGTLVAGNIDDNTSPTGGGGAHANMQPFRGLYWIIKA